MVQTTAGLRPAVSDHNRSPEDMKKPMDLTPIGFLLLPLLFIAAGLSISYALVVLGFQRTREKRLTKRLSAVGRLASG